MTNSKGFSFGYNILEKIYIFIFNFPGIRLRIRSPLKICGKYNIWVIFIYLQSAIFPECTPPTTSTPIVSSTFTHHDLTIAEESLNSLKKVSTEENWQ